MYFTVNAHKAIYVVLRAMRSVTNRPDNWHFNAKAGYQAQSPRLSDPKKQDLLTMIKNSMPELSDPVGDDRVMSCGEEGVMSTDEEYGKYKELSNGLQAFEASNKKSKDGRM